MKAKRPWLILLIGLTIVLLPYVLWKVALSAYGGPQEAIWAFVFYGSILTALALPIMIFSLIARWIARCRRKQLAKEAASRCEEVDKSADV
jgi:hypothetical protein